MVPIKATFARTTVPVDWATMRTYAETIFEPDLEGRIHRCILEIYASKGRKLEICHLAYHSREGLNDLEVLKGRHLVPAVMQLIPSSMFHEYVLGTNRI